MPPEKETARVKKVRQDLGSFLTQARHSIKDHVRNTICTFVIPYMLTFTILRCQIRDSVENPDSGKDNIADLAAAVIGRTGIKPTVQLYIRLAFLVS